MVKIVESGCRDCTVTLDGTECAVEFPANYRVFSAKNMTDSDIIMSVESGKTAADDGVRIVEAGGVGALNHMRSDINTLYITGTGKVQISAGNEAVLPFKAAEKGGDTVSASGNPVQLSGLQGGVPFAEIKVKSPNMLPMPYTTDSADTTGVDVVVHEDGSVGVHGTASTGHYIVWFCKSARHTVSIKKGKTYRMVCNREYNTVDNNIVCTLKYNSGNENITLGTGSFTAKEDGIILRLTLWLDKGNTIDVDGLWVMLVEDDGTEYADFFPPITGRELTVSANGTDYTITPDSNPYTIPNDIRQQDGLNNISVSAGELRVVGVKENAAIKRIYDDFSLELLFDGLARADSPAVGVDFSKHSKFIVSNYLNTLSSKCDYAGTVLIERDRLESLISNASFLDVPVSTQYSVQNHFSGTISNASFYAVQSMDSSALYATRIYGIR